MNELIRGKLKTVPTRRNNFQKTCISHVEFKGKTKIKMIPSANEFKRIV